MKWLKQGLIYKPSGQWDWSLSHAQLPIVDPIGKDILRIYFGTRDAQTVTRPTYIEVEADNPQNVLYIHDRPVMDTGQLGCFDDSGVMPSWIVNREGEKWLYYIGWNTGQTVPYRNSIGLAISRDGGQTFERKYTGPIVDRSPTEPHFCAAPCVIWDDGLWKMWYLSCVKWEMYNGHPEPFYHIKYAESDDGIVWKREGLVAIDFKSEDEAGIVRSCVIKEEGLYKMWYSYRTYKDYRTQSSNSYRMGYAESQNGKAWVRKDEEVGIDVSAEGWDCLMIGYPYRYKHQDKTYLFYNGNGFGESGLGYAILDR